MNEGFARYMQYIATANIKPHYQMNKQFMNMLFNVQYIDSVADSRPVTSNVGSPAEIETIFDVILYDKVINTLKLKVNMKFNLIFSKGASILSMVCNFLGNETFYKGLTVINITV